MTLRRLGCNVLRMTTSESQTTMIGTLRRPVTFGYTDLHTKVRSDFRTFPAGTEVYCRERRSGFELRIPGTLLTATPPLSVVEPA